MEKKQVSSANAAPGNAYISQAVKYGDILLIGGQYGLDPKTGELVGPDIKSQTKQTLESMKAILAEEGMTMNDVLMCRCFISTMDDFAGFNEVYAQYFTDVDVPPARYTVQTGLGAGMKIEIAAYAAKK